MPYDNVEYYNYMQAKNAKLAEVPESKRSLTSKRELTSKRSAHEEPVPPSAGSSAPSLPGLFSKSLMNRSSVKTNIITGVDNIFSCQMKPGILDHQAFNRKKGITEFRDLMTKANKNMDHNNALDKNEGVFKRHNGIFTHLYNAAARFGETEVFKH